jgi:hypothetical protein
VPGLRKSAVRRAPLDAEAAAWVAQCSRLSAPDIPRLCPVKRSGVGSSRHRVGVERWMLPAHAPPNGWKDTLAVASRERSHPDAFNLAKIEDLHHLGCLGRRCAAALFLLSVLQAFARPGSAKLATAGHTITHD